MSDRENLEIQILEGLLRSISSVTGEAGFGYGGAIHNAAEELAKQAVTNFLGDDVEETESEMEELWADMDNFTED